MPLLLPKRGPRNPRLEPCGAHLLGHVEGFDCWALFGRLGSCASWVEGVGFREEGLGLRGIFLS